VPTTKGLVNLDNTYFRLPGFDPTPLQAMAGRGLVIGGSRYRANRRRGLAVKVWLGMARRGEAWSGEAVMAGRG
jgi:hypothetical protein